MPNVWPLPYWLCMRWKDARKSAWICAAAPACQACHPCEGAVLITRGTMLERCTASLVGATWTVQYPLLVFMFVMVPCATGRWFMT